MRLQKVLREMLVIGIVLSVPLYIANHAYNFSSIFSALLLGILLSPIGWAIYRVGRYVILPRHETTF